MPSPGAPAPPRLPIEDSYLELLAETLDGLDLPARGQFLQRYLRAITHLDLREAQGVQVWDDMLSRRRELSNQAGRPISLMTALVDVLSTAGLLRVPIIIEYDELKNLQLNAVTDALTGLYNRRHFVESFEKELNRARRYVSPLGLVILDLHRFKEVNDKHGHPRGDDVLRAAAATLKKALRTSDYAFRIGGDEFALLLPQTDAPQALALSRRIEAVFAEMLQPLQLAVSVSMDHGVANFSLDGDDAEQLIRVADERLFRMKHENHRKAANGASQVETPEPLHSAPEPPAAVPPERAASLPAPISIESKRPPEKIETTIEAAASITSAAISANVTPPPPRTFAVPRKAERVSMTGTNAYAVIGEQGSRRARVLDLGFGGVAIELDSPEELPENLLAVLHVPILPPVRVNLKPVWKQQTSQGNYRVGCAFVS
ncbi:MAG TPA: GGDEF domain-containing protein [Candidatus Acidoferrum sp.]|nr:GGDEF domain-containing protein [Candidatus Acidoferrum sp.]